MDFFLMLKAIGKYRQTGFQNKKTTFLKTNLVEILFFYYLD
jgi:hypothetical protein